MPRHAFVLHQKHMVERSHSLLYETVPERIPSDQAVRWSSVVRVQTRTCWRLTLASRVEIE
jgi:hypothetical protein